MERWVPGSVEDIRQALDDGRLVEDHHNDFKVLTTADSGKPRQKANRNLAVDIAAMAVDGGRLWIGVHGHDQDDADPEVVEVELTGLAERVESVARAIPTPPVHVRCRDVGGPHRGVLLVEVPWSPEAPHMVDGRYRGRGDRTNRELSDAEVRDLLDRRRRDAKRGADLVMDEVERDPLVNSRTLARLHMVAAPAVPRTSTMLLDHVDDFRSWFDADMAAAMRSEPPGLAKLWADWLGPMTAEPRLGGWARSRFPLAPDGRTLEPIPDIPAAPRVSDATDLEVREDGTIRFYNASMANDQVLEIGRLLGFVWHVLAMAGRTAETMGYVGPWNVGLALVGAGRLREQAYPGTGTARPGTPALNRDPYVSSATLSTEQLRDLEGAIDRLCGELCRGVRASTKVTRHYR